MKRFLLISGPQGSKKSLLVEHIVAHASTAFDIYDPLEPNDVECIWREIHKDRSIIAVTNDVDTLRAQLRGRDVARFEVLIGKGTHIRLVAP